MSPLQSVAQCFRSLRKNPAFAAVAILTLTLGIGACTAVFSVVHGVLLEPLAYPDSDRLVDVSASAPGLGFFGVEISDAIYFHYRDNGKTLTELGLYFGQSRTLTEQGEPERLAAGAATASLFGALGAVPQMGRSLVEDDELPGAEKVALLSDGLWKRRFGADPEIIGKSILLDDLSWRVVGVMHQGFAFPDSETELWVPLTLDRTALAHGNFNFDAVGRLAPGVTPARAEAELAALTDRLPEIYPEDFPVDLIEQAGLTATVTPLLELQVRDVRTTLWLLLGSAGGLMLIACANVANLFLVRAETRQRELAVRTALGAGRANLARTFLVESLLLAGLGGLAGLALAAVGVQALVMFGPAEIPRLSEISIDRTVLAFTSALTLLTGLVFGLFPLLRRSRSRLSANLRDGGRTATQGRARHRVRGALVAVQVALALVLLIGSGLMLRTFVELTHVDPGFQSDRALTLTYSLPRARYESAQEVARFHTLALERFAALPGVRSAGGISRLPLDPGMSQQGTAFEDFPVDDGDLPIVLPYVHATPGYFDTMGIPLVEGRTFTNADHEDPTGTAIISSNLARRMWPDGSAIGKRLRPNDADNGEWYTIVGVVGAVRSTGLENQPTESIFYPLVPLPPDSWTVRALSVVLRTDGDPLALAGAARSVVGQLDARLPVTRVRSLEQVVARSRARTSFTALLLAIAAGTALALGSVGLYGVVTYVTSQRTHEIGVRMALGAARGKVTSMVLKQGLSVAVLGLILGLIGAAITTRWLTAFLYEVDPLDPITFVAVPLLLLVAAGLASYLPARRAAAVEPVEALRAED